MEIMAALLPCAWSYVEIAGRLADGGGTDHEVYADWIGYFTLPSNVEMVAAMRADFDRLAIEGELGAAKRAELGRDLRDELAARARLLGDGVHATSSGRTCRPADRRHGGLP